MSEPLQPPDGVTPPHLRETPAESLAHDALAAIERGKELCPVCNPDGWQEAQKNLPSEHSMHEDVRGRTRARRQREKVASDDEQGPPYPRLLAQTATCNPGFAEAGSPHQEHALRYTYDAALQRLQNRARSENTTLVGPVIVRVVVEQFVEEK